MQKSTFIAKTGTELLYEYKGFTYTVDTRKKPIAEQHRALRNHINKIIDKERTKK